MVLNAVRRLLSLASKIVSVIKMFNVSVECSVLFPLWWTVRRLLRDIYSISWFKAARSQILETAGSREIGRLDDYPRDRD